MREVAVGDLFYVHVNCDLPIGWYIVQAVIGREVIVVGVENRRTELIYWPTLSRNIGRLFSREHLESLNFGWRSRLVRKYFELMGGPERINWLAEGF